MGDAAQTTCFGRTKSKKSKSGNRNDRKTAVSISPLSSINSDQVIKAHRLGLFGDEKAAKPAAQVDLFAELAEERNLRRKLEEQMSTALNVNAELKLSLMLAEEEHGRATVEEKLARAASLVQQERDEKEELELQLAAAKREAAALRAALNAARAQRDDLEAELTEAALDVMDSQRHNAGYTVAVKSAEEARQQAEQAMAECEALRHQLKASETARKAVEKKMKAMSLDARDWELALDSLQERLEDALMVPPLHSIQASKLHLLAPETPSPTHQPMGESRLSVDVLLNEGLRSCRKATSSSDEGSVEAQSASEDESTTPKVEPWRQVIIPRPFLQSGRA